MLVVKIKNHHKMVEFKQLSSYQTIEFDPNYKPAQFRLIWLIWKKKIRVYFLSP